MSFFSDKSAIKTSHDSKTSLPISGEKLLLALAGNVMDDDYLGKSVLALQSFAMRKVDPFTGLHRRYSHKESLSFDDSHRLIQPGYLDMEHGYARNTDGTYCVACLTDLGTEVSGEMIDWWFSHCDDTERYRWWHPLDHISCTWDVQYFSSMSENRVFGHYIEHTHKVVEKVDGMTKNLEIVFQRPSKFFDVSRFSQAGITACICARIYSNESDIGMVGIGHLVHMVRKVGGRSELRSRFWLGDVHKQEDLHNLASARLINYFANTSWFRYFKLSDKLAEALWIHCAEEMHCLKSFLPSLYAKEIDMNTLKADQLAHLNNT